jgi:hypothetical protein
MWTFLECRISGIERAQNEQAWVKVKMWSPWFKNYEEFQSSKSGAVNQTQSRSEPV